jgi:hypothetical protein
MFKERFSNVAKVVPYGGDCITPFVLSLANWLYPTFPTMGHALLRNSIHLKNWFIE